ncbi:MAG TPA: antitoxin [Frankiaceae bacterium]|nr:antitoxin [Frankiaceae bacterium]
MRTTVDLPDDVHELIRSLAHDRRQTFSQALTDLIRRSTSEAAEPVLRVNQISGLRTVHLGATTTTEDVRSLEDEE